MICFLCQYFFKGKSILRLRKALWRKMWEHKLTTKIMCSYLLPNGSCGKSKGMTRQKLIHWFETEGKEIVKTYVALDYPSKVELTRMKDGKVEKVGEIEVKERRKRCH